MARRAAEGPDVVPRRLVEVGGLGVGERREVGAGGDADMRCAEAEGADEEAAAEETDRRNRKGRKSVVRRAIRRASGVSYTVHAGTRDRRPEAYVRGPISLPGPMRTSPSSPPLRPRPPRSPGAAASGFRWVVRPDPLEVAGRYRFTEYVTSTDLRGRPRRTRCSAATRPRRRGRSTSTRRDGPLERCATTARRGPGTGSYTIAGRRSASGSTATSDDYLLPNEVDFEGGGERLRAEVFREGLNMERIATTTTASRAPT